MTITTQPEFLNDLTAHRPCDDAFVWAQSFESLQAAWDHCERADWLLWLIGKTSTESDRERIVSIACECARLALPYTQDPRVLKCIETTEAWVRGEATIQDVRKVRVCAAADDAAGCAAAAAADDAAAVYAAVYAAAAAAAAAAYATDAAAYATDAAAYAAYATAAADGAAARKQVQKQCADIVRKHWPIAPELKVKP